MQIEAVPYRPKPRWEANLRDPKSTARSKVSFLDALVEAVADFGLDPLSPRQIEQLACHYAMLCRWNERVNLTRVIDPKQAARRHYAESLYGASFVKGARRVLDVGSGAGFPAIPLAVVKPDIEVTALESNQKKSVFLKEAKDAVGVNNLSVVAARFEEFDCLTYDLLTSRALDSAGQVYPEMIATLDAGRSLMLFCSPELLDSVSGTIPDSVKITVHQIPLTNQRLVVFFEKSITPEI